MSDYEPTPCFNDYVRICREQQSRIESLELAITAVCEEIDHGASTAVAQRMLRSALEAMESIE